MAYIKTPCPNKDIVEVLKIQQKGVGCSHAIYIARNIFDRWVSMGYTANLCAIDLTKAFDQVNNFVN